MKTRTEKASLPQEDYKNKPLYLTTCIITAVDRLSASNASAKINMLYFYKAYYKQKTQQRIAALHNLK